MRLDELAHGAAGRVLHDDAQLGAAVRDERLVVLDHVRAVELGEDVALVDGLLPRRAAGPIAICFRQKVRRRESPRSRRRVTAHTTPNEPSPSLRTTSKSAILVTLERGATTFGGLTALGADETRAEASPSGIARGARAFDRGARTRMTRRTRATATATARGRARAETHRERGEGRRGRSGEGRRGRDPRRETTSARPAASVSDNAKR